MARDILKTLKTEHDALLELFEQIKATTDRAKKTRTDLLEEIEANLLPHAKWEEQVFYPATKTTKPGRPPTPAPARLPRRRPRPASRAPPGR